jgi:hypothetical protein
VLKHPLDGVMVLRGWGGCARAVGVGSGKERGRFIGDAAWSGGWVAGGTTRWRGVGRGLGASAAVGRRGMTGSGRAAALTGSP